jgi:hypothetical protein
VGERRREELDPAAARPAGILEQVVEPTPTSFTFICWVNGTLKLPETFPCALVIQPMDTVSPR